MLLKLDQEKGLFNEEWIKGQFTDGNNALKDLVYSSTSLLLVRGFWDEIF